MRDQTNVIMADMGRAMVRVTIILGTMFLIMIAVSSVVHSIYVCATYVGNTTISIPEWEANKIGNDTMAASLPEAPSTIKPVEEVDETTLNITYAVEDSEAYDGSITEYTDLLNRMDISENDIARCIRYMTSFGNNLDSVLNSDGIAAAYIEASRQSGLDPIFLVALSGLESSWTVTDLHREKCNFYSIGMYDSDPNEGLVLGKTYEEGIINGAIYIRENWYDVGNTNIHDMEYEGEYSSDEEWASKLTSIMNTCYTYLEEESWR
jgi:beta-N-acetylglucosaminidase